MEGSSTGSKRKTTVIPSTIEKDLNTSKKRKEDVNVTPILLNTEERKKYKQEFIDYQIQGFKILETNLNKLYTDNEKTKVQFAFKPHADFTLNQIQKFIIKYCTWFQIPKNVPVEECLSQFVHVLTTIQTYIINLNQLEEYCIQYLIYQKHNSESFLFVLERIGQFLIILIESKIKIGTLIQKNADNYFAILESLEKLFISNYTKIDEENSEIPTSVRQLRTTLSKDRLDIYMYTSRIEKLIGFYKGKASFVLYNIFENCKLCSRLFSKNVNLHKIVKDFAMEYNEIDKSDIPKSNLKTSIKFQERLIQQKIVTISVHSDILTIIEMHENNILNSFRILIKYTINRNNRVQISDLQTLFTKFRDNRINDQIMDTNSSTKLDERKSGWRFIGSKYIWKPDWTDYIEAPKKVKKRKKKKPIKFEYWVNRKK